MTSLTTERTKLSDFELIISKESKIIETIMRASNENFCLVPFLRKADRIAIEKSSRLVTISYHQLVFG
jgi:transposase-like protein